MIYKFLFFLIYIYYSHNTIYFTTYTFAKKMMKNTKYKNEPLLAAIRDIPKCRPLEIIEMVKKMTKEDLQKEFDLDDIYIWDVAFHPDVPRTVGTAALVYLWLGSNGWMRSCLHRQYILELTSLLVEKGSLSLSGIYGDVDPKTGKLLPKGGPSLREMIQECILDRDDDPPADISLEMRWRFQNLGIFFSWPRDLSLYTDKKSSI
jgi:hypothetical protein